MTIFRMELIERDKTQGSNKFVYYSEGNKCLSSSKIVLFISNNIDEAIRRMKGTKYTFLK